MSDSMGTGGRDLCETYESLRAHATGHGTGIPLPQGLALLRRCGMPAWMAAWEQITVVARAGDRSDDAVVRPQGEETTALVTLLTAMVLDGRGKE